jgi:hypothetical protein
MADIAPSIGAERFRRDSASFVRWKAGYGRLQTMSFLIHADPAQLAD